MDMPRQFDDSVHHAIEEYLAQVKTALKEAGSTTSEIDGILDDLRTHISEMLTARVEGVPTRQDVQLVLAELDSPESYATAMEEQRTPAPPIRRFVPLLLWGSMGIPFFLVMHLLLFRAAHVRPISWAPRSLLIMWAISIPGLLGTTVIGAIALSRIARSKIRLRGRLLAFIECFIGSWLLVSMLMHFSTLYIMEEFSLRGAGYLPWVVLAGLVCAGVTAWLWLWPIVKRWGAQD